MKTKSIIVLTITIILSLGSALAQNEWSIMVSGEQLKDEAINVAINDLVTAGGEYHISFKIIQSPPQDGMSVIVVGNEERNNIAKQMLSDYNLQMEEVNHPEGYVIKTWSKDEQKIIFISGGSELGDAYGIYWIWDRLRVNKQMTEINVQRQPSLPIRYTRVRVRSIEDIQRALRYGLNTVYLGDQLGLGIWGVEPEDSENRENREKIQFLIDYTHKLHMKCLAFGTEFTFHPNLLEEFQASLSPCDENLWKALQEKYRRVLKALPELDGVATFTGPEQSFWGDYKKFNLMHGDLDCEWPLDKRYRTFVKKVQEVVVGEFGKIYHHRTWMTNMFEQQARYEVYKKIFTDEVPVENLYLIPSFTQNDRWWHQRYNPTFNLTPHQMLAVLEPMNYYESSKSNIFPTYPGIYYQAGLESVLEVPNSNLKGLSCDLYGPENFRTPRLSAYTVFRLGWDYMEDPLQIAEDFCAIFFGPEAAKDMAKIYMLSPVAYKYGLFIEPVAYGEFNSLPHIRVGTFPAQGYPVIDNGKEHLAFWRKIYLRCKPWITETYDDLDHGFETAKKMRDMFKLVKSLIKDSDIAQQVEVTLEMTYQFVHTNNLYVRTVFAYFTYLDDPSTENKIILTNTTNYLKNTIAAFKSVPDFNYKLFGVDQILSNAEQILADRSKALEILDKAPTSERIENTIALLHKRYNHIFQEYEGELTKILHFEGQIDGRDILRIQEDSYEIEHLRWDPPSIKECSFENPLPKKSGSLILQVNQSREVFPFVLEQPSKDNGYTAQIYMYDIPEGRDWVKFDLYFIDKTPEELELVVPW